MNDINARAIYSAILGRGYRAVPTYSEVRRDVQAASRAQYRTFIG